MIIRAALVYQAGLANVFVVDAFNWANYKGFTRADRNARRIMQGAFSTCEMFARGLEANGTIVRSAHCNRVGDISNARWDGDLSNAPFRESMHQVNTH